MQYPEPSAVCSTCSNLPHQIDSARSSRASRQAGYVSIEMLFVMLVVLIGVGYALFNGSALMGTSDIGNEQGNIGQLIANTRKLKGMSGYGASSTNLVPQLIAVKGVPNMSVSGGALYNAWGGSVTVVSNGMTFTVTENGLPQDACISLASKMSRGSKATTAINSGTAITGEVDSAAATSGCSKDTGNTLAWTVY